MRALVREVSDALATYGVDVPLARAQHANYCEALGLEIITLAADPTLADCCFVEDTAIVDHNRALITHMGFPERRPESAAIQEALEDLGYETTVMEPPATLDGGDVLRVGATTFVGLSTRTNEEGVRGLEQFLGQACTRIPVTKCLHLKSAVTAYDDETLLIDPDLLPPDLFRDYTLIETKRPNCLRLPDRVLVSDPALRGTYLDISELQKADGALTCSSLLIR